MHPGVFVHIQAHTSVHTLRVPTNAHSYTQEPSGKQPSGRTLASNGYGELSRERAGVGKGREEGGGSRGDKVSRETGLLLETPGGTAAPRPFLQTQSLPGQLASSLSLGLCPPAKIFGAKKMPFVLSDGVSW